MKRPLLLVLLPCLACTPAPEDGVSFGEPSTSATDTQVTGEETEASTSTDTHDTTPATDTEAETSTDSDTTGDGDGDDETKFDLGSNDSPSGLPEIAEVFGHSADTLYRLDPDTLEVTEVGPLTGCDSSVLGHARVDLDLRRAVGVERGGRQPGGLEPTREQRAEVAAAAGR